MENFDLKEVIMACGDSGISQGLLAIAQAISVSSGGGGVGGCGCLGETGGVQVIVTLPDDSQWPIYGSGPIVPLPESGFPEGYDDQADYDEDKCRKATKMIDDLIATLDRLGNIEWGLGVVGVLVVVGCLVGLIVVPEVVIPTLIWILVANTGITAALIQAEGYISDNREEWICYLLESDSVEAVIAVISTALGVMVAALSLPGAMGIAVTSLVLHLLNNDTLSALFNSQAAHQYPEVDCSSCTDCVITFDWDTNVDALGWTVSNVVGGTPYPGSDQGEVYSIVRDAGGGGNWHYSFVSAELEEPHLVVAGDELHIHCFLDGACTLYWGFLSDVHPSDETYGIYAAYGSGTIDGEVDQLSDLSAYAGETITHLGVYLAVGGDVGRILRMESMGFECP
jgi:hypothetical protein